jgi:hypothetical protein
MNSLSAIKNISAYFIQRTKTSCTNELYIKAQFFLILITVLSTQYSTVNKLSLFLFGFILNKVLLCPELITYMPMHK